MRFKRYTDEEKALRKQLIISLKKEVTVAEVASNLLGLTVIRSSKTNSRYLKTVEHGSLVLDMKRNVAFWNAITSNRQLNVIDLYMVFNNVGADVACNKLIEYYQERDPQKIDLYKYDIENDASQEFNGLDMPKKARNNDKVVLYLTEKRGLNESLVRRLIDEGKIYQDTYNNAVFIDYDRETNKTPCFGFRRGTSEIKFQRDVSGSFKRNGYFIKNNNAITKLVLCGSMIDGLSYATICYKSKASHSLDAHVLCSSGEGCALTTLIYNLLNNTSLKKIDEIEVLMDFDDAGRCAADKIESYFKNDYHCLYDNEKAEREILLERFPVLFNENEHRIKINEGKLYKSLSYGEDIEFGQKIEKTNEEFIKINEIKDLNDIAQNMFLVLKLKEERDVFQNETNDIQSNKSI